MMNIHQTKKRLASLSPKLVNSESDRLTSYDAIDAKGQIIWNQSNDKQREHATQVSYSSENRQDESSLRF